MHEETLNDSARILKLMLRKIIFIITTYNCYYLISPRKYTMNNNNMYNIYSTFTIFISK